MGSLEVQSELIGEMVAKRLKKLDKVAYIRFASVFKRFVDVEDFEKEMKGLQINLCVVLSEYLLTIDL